MNLCLVSREYPPFFEGGIGAYTRRLARALADEGHRVCVLTASDSAKMAREVEQNLTVVRLPRIDFTHSTLVEAVRGMSHPAAAAMADAAAHGLHREAAFAYHIAKSLPDLIDDFDVDVIEFPDTGALGWFWMLREASAQRNPPSVLCLHSPTAWINEWNRVIDASPAGRALAQMEEDCIRAADAIVCPSHDLAQWTASRMGLSRERITVVPLPMGELERHDRDRRRSPARGLLRLLYVGRLEPRKGIDVLLAGAAEAANRGVRLHLDIVGRDTSDPRTLRDFGRRSLDLAIRSAPALTAAERRAATRGRCRIEYHGPRRPERLSALRAAAHAVVVPSPMDNYPNVCLEAMAEGVAVIASRAGGMAEMIRDGQDGFLFEPGRIRACAGAIERAAQAGQEHLDRMGRSAAERIAVLAGRRAVLPARVAHFEQAVHASPPAVAGVHSPVPDSLREQAALLVARGALESESAAHARRRAAAALAQLDTIHASRGWRALRAVYAVLHRARGRAKDGPP